VKPDLRALDSCHGLCEKYAALHCAVAGGTLELFINVDAMHYVAPNSVGARFENLLIGTRPYTGRVLLNTFGVYCVHNMTRSDVGSAVKTSEAAKRAVVAVVSDAVSRAQAFGHIETLRRCATERTRRVDRAYLETERDTLVKRLADIERELAAL
jgi:hypothetical protein